MSRSSPSELRPLKRLLGLAVVGFAALALTSPGTGGTSPGPPGVPGVGFSHEQLQIDANMIDQMSIPNAHTERQNHRSDPQVARSRSPGYLAAIELHQADIDRMLARR